MSEIERESLLSWLKAAASWYRKQGDVAAMIAFERAATKLFWSQNIPVSVPASSQFAGTFTESSER
jgi:hypothetical protein